MHIDQRQLAQQRLADQLSEGADRDRLGTGAAEPLKRGLGVDVIGLEQVDLEL